MKRRRPFSQEKLVALREVCRGEPRLAALYAFGSKRKLDCELAALFCEPLPWPERLELELVIAEALGLESVELIDLGRMPLVFRFGVVDEGDPIYVGQPDRLAIFIEETLARYSSFYPLLEALYWKVETGPLSGELL